jgi:nicotinate-nucleotide adenylyltransferase
MVRLATADNPAFDVCDLEVRRGGRSYTVDTIKTLREEFPAAEFTFVAGADVIANLHLWHKVEQLLSLCHFTIVTRPGYDLDLEALYTTLPAARGRVTPLVGPALEISATALRERFERDAPVRYQVPDAVLEYIEAHGLYRPRD